MFYVTQLHAGHRYICETTQEAQAGLYVPMALNHAYETKSDADAAHALAQAAMAPQTITPDKHTRSEWVRMAQVAYNSERRVIGHRYAIAAAKMDHPMRLQDFDQLQAGYRAWLVFGEWPAA